jgi:peptidoglycan/xylan/chitin deacetylase (PgdA/CDA1 family)/glycosyltransferase involved in cell wall biosynthesis
MLSLTSKVLAGGGKKNNQLIILNYHRVLPANEMDENFAIAFDHELFFNQMSWLKNNFTILPLEKAISLLKQGQLPKRAVSISVDDGYLDSYQVIYPILKSLNVTAAFFISTKGLEDGHLWYDEIVEAILQTEQLSIEVLDTHYQVSTHQHKKTSILQLVEIIKYLSLTERHQAIQSIYQQCGEPTITKRFVNVEQIKEMHDNGMLIGAHTHSHPILMKESQEIATDEILQSQKILENIIKDTVDYFAYPNGKKHLDFDEKHIEILKSLGFKAALSSDWGVAKTNKTELLSLPRFTPWDETENYFVMRLAMAFRKEPLKLEHNKLRFNMPIKKDKIVLMVVHDFPPCRSAGVQRTLKLAEYISQLGWQPIILTVNREAHVALDDNQIIPEAIAAFVFRTKAYNAARDFAYKGKHFEISKVPDKWWSWSLSAIPLGKKLIDSYKPDLIFSTYPIPTAHFIAYKLKKYSNIPWIADFRDPVQCRYDQNMQKYSSVVKWIEKKVAEHSKQMVFTTEPSKRLYQQLYPDLPEDRFSVITNGFDEQVFNYIENNTDHKVESDKPFILLYSGALYANGRDPVPLFDALSLLKKEGVICEQGFSMTFRGAGNGGEYQSYCQQKGIDNIVRFLPPVSYIESIKEMLSANALVLIQDSVFNYQIPGKAYEYLRSKLPVLALTPTNSATEEILASNELCFCATEAKAIAAHIENIISITSKRSQASIEPFSRLVLSTSYEDLFSKAINKVVD